jgi:hypothetical protein
MHSWWFPLRICGPHDRRGKPYATAALPESELAALPESTEAAAGLTSVATRGGRKSEVVMKSCDLRDGS